VSDRRKTAEFTYEQVRHVRIAYKPNPDDPETYLIAETVIVERRITSGTPLPDFPRFISQRTAMLEDKRVPMGQVPVQFEVPALKAKTPEEAFREIEETGDDVERESLKIARAQLEEQINAAMRAGPGLWTPGQEMGPSGPSGPMPGPGFRGNGR